MQLKDKVAIITGAASGFGEAIAKRFAAEGAQVVVDDINAAGGERVAEEIRKAGGAAQFVQADVTSSRDWAALVATTQARLGRLDIVVNNAGWTHRNKPFMDVSEEEFDHVYATNVKSIYLSALHALPVFRAQGGGCFVNIASTAGVRPRPGLTVYNSSKGAVILLSKSMAAEFGPDQVRVNCVNPVFCPDTGLSVEFAGGQNTPEVHAKFRATVPMGRLSSVRDIANAALFLASDEAAFVSGTCLEVDGGRCC
ncbi:MAG: SDR family oxidoreductase [Burkholderiales bacterium]|nr:SDR family oxidoreductase [Burkholderiales bacterium]